MCEWRTARLGELFDLDNTKLGPYTDEPTVFSLSKYDGFVRAEDYFDKRIASSKLDGYKVVPPEGWAFSTIHIDEGSISRNKLGVKGVISPMYTTMTWRSPEDDPAYVALLLRSRRLLAEYAYRAQGTVNRRRSLPFKAFAEIEVSLPPVKYQRRVVGIVDAVDRQIEALGLECEQAAQLLDASVTQVLASLPETVSLGSIATVRSGPSWSASDEAKTPVNGGLRVVKITNTRSTGVIDMSDETYVRGLPEATPVLDEASIVLVRTNGNRQRIGNAYLPTPGSLGCAVSAFQFIVRANDHLERDFLFWALREPRMQSRMSEAASGSTGLGNLAARWLKAAEIPWTSSVDARTEIVVRLTALAGVVDSLRSEVACLQEVRADLVEGLLCGEITIPDSYDDLLEVA